MKVFQTKKKKKLDGQRLQTNLKERKHEEPQGVKFLSRNLIS